MSYTGFGYYQPPPPKPSRRPLWIALSVLAVLALAGGVTAVVLTRDPAEPAPTTSTRPVAQVPWQTVEDVQSGVTYELPESWQSSGGGATGRVRLNKSLVSRPFECQGREMVQAQVASGLVIRDSPAEVAREVAAGIAEGGYTVDGRKPTLGEPRVESEDDDKAVVSVEARPNAVNPCFAPKATVTAVALRNGAKVSVVVLNVAEGGPHVAEGPGEDDVKRILESVRLR